VHISYRRGSPSCNKSANFFIECESFGDWRFPPRSIYYWVKRMVYRSFITFAPRYARGGRWAFPTDCLNPAAS